MTRLRVTARYTIVEITLADGQDPFFWWSTRPDPALSRTIDAAIADGGDLAEALVRHDRTLKIERVGERSAA
jgi:hypothetical protein